MRRCGQPWIRAAAALGLLLASLAASASAQPPSQAPAGQRPGRSDPAFSQPSIGPGIDYTVPSEAEIKAVLDRIRDHFVRDPRRIASSTRRRASPSPI